MDSAVVKSSLRFATFNSMHVNFEVTPIEFNTIYCQVKCASNFTQTCKEMSNYGGTKEGGAQGESEPPPPQDVTTILSKLLGVYICIVGLPPPFLYACA